MKHENFEGRLFTEGRYEIMGGLGGLRFDAELETVYGRDRPPFWSTNRPRNRRADFRQLTKSPPPEETIRVRVVPPCPKHPPLRSLKWLLEFRWPGK